MIKVLDVNESPIGADEHYLVYFVDTFEEELLNLIDNNFPYKLLD